MFEYTVGSDGDMLYVVDKNNAARRMKVECDAEWTYKLMKRKILAREGAAGLAKWADRCIADDFCLCLVRKVCDHVMSHGEQMNG